MFSTYFCIVQAGQVFLLSGKERKNILLEAFQVGTAGVGTKEQWFSSSTYLQGLFSAHKVTVFIDINSGMLEFSSLSSKVTTVEPL